MRPQQPLGFLKSRVARDQRAAGAARPFRGQSLLSSICVSFIPKAMETEPQTIDKSWICLTPPSHCGLPPTLWLLATFAPGPLKNGETHKAKNVKGPDGYDFALPRQMNMAVAPNSISMKITSIVDVSMSEATVQITAASGKGYASLAKRGYKHFAIAKHIHIFLVFAILKTWLNSTHQGVSHKHLQAYLNEFTFHFNSRFYPFNAFRSLLGIASGVTAPTYAELYSGAWKHPTLLA
jgi:hypothetical protein